MERVAEKRSGIPRYRVRLDVFDCCVLGLELAKRKTKQIGRGLAMAELWK